MYVSSHPLAPLRDQLSRKTDTPLRGLQDLRDGQIVTVGGIVASLRPMVTKRGDQNHAPSAAVSRKHGEPGRSLGIARLDVVDQEQ